MGTTRPAGPQEAGSLPRWGLPVPRCPTRRVASHLGGLPVPRGPTRRVVSRLPSRETTPIPRKPTRRVAFRDGGAYPPTGLGTFRGEPPPNWGDSPSRGDLRGRESTDGGTPRPVDSLPHSSLFFCRHPIKSDACSSRASSTVTDFSLSNTHTPTLATTDSSAIRCYYCKSLL